jgi:hypothetical protein
MRLIRPAELFMTQRYQFENRKPTVSACVPDLDVALTHRRGSIAKRICRRDFGADRRNLDRAIRGLFWEEMRHALTYISLRSSGTGK